MMMNEFVSPIAHVHELSYVTNYRFYGFLSVALHGAIVGPRSELTIRRPIFLGLDWDYLLLN